MEIRNIISLMVLLLFAGILLGCIPEIDGPPRPPQQAAENTTISFGQMVRFIAEVMVEGTKIPGEKTSLE